MRAKAVAVRSFRSLIAYAAATATATDAVARHTAASVSGGCEVDGDGAKRQDDNALIATVVGGETQQHGPADFIPLQRHASTMPTWVNEPSAGVACAAAEAVGRSQRSCR